MQVVRLGEGVDRTGRLADQALQRVFTAVEEYAATIASLHVEATRFCATSAARDAANASVFVEGVESRIGVTPEVLSGGEEARLSYEGATASLSDSGLPAPFLVMDIGGGSTELILGDEPRTVRAAYSLDIGSVRITERLLPGDPPGPDEVATASAAVDAALDELPTHGVRLEEAATFVGVAGTVTTVAAMALALPSYQRDRVHHARLPVAEVHAATASLLAMTVAERKALPFMHPGRADVIGAGALILDRVLRRTPVDALLVSEADILDGIAWSLAHA
jgi:exopolyphosphatase / guanosine-5'-triphosphate,3'-diphosphate pyrophosphatase